MGRSQQTQPARPRNFLGERWDEAAGRPLRGETRSCREHVAEPDRNRDLPWTAQGRVRAVLKYRLTVNTYDHLDVSDLREAMETLVEATGVHPVALPGEDA